MQLFPIDLTFNTSLIHIALYVNTLKYAKHNLIVRGFLKIILDRKCNFSSSLLCGPTILKTNRV